MAHDVIWYDSYETGAPTLNNAAGSLTSLLDACLVDGFSSKSVTSIVIDDGVATVTASAHGYAAGKIVEIAGATPAGLNGRQKIAAVTGANAFTFATTETGSVTGMITVKRPGLGWTKAFTGTNKRIYGRSDPAATAMLLRVDDTLTNTYARIRGCESATDVDTIVDPFPIDGYVSGGHYAQKGANNSTPKRWQIIGDGRFIHVFSELTAGFVGGIGCLGHWAFGDIVPLIPIDPYGCVISGHTSTATTDSAMIETSVYGFLPSAITANGMVLARGGNGFVKSPRAGTCGPISGRIGGSSVGAYAQFPNRNNGGFVCQSNLPVLDASTPSYPPPRGFIPGMLAPLHEMPDNLVDTIVSNLVGMGGRRALCVPSRGGSSGSGGVLIDIDGPWR